MSAAIQSGACFPPETPPIYAAISDESLCIRGCKNKHSGDMKAESLKGVWPVDDCRLCCDLGENDNMVIVNSALLQFTGAPSIYRLLVRSDGQSGLALGLGDSI